MPNKNHLEQLTMLLRDATVKNMIWWQQTPEKDTFRVRLPSGSCARISHERRPTAGEGGEWHYVLELRDEQGHVVQEWTSEGLDHLHEAARISAAKADDFLKGLPSGNDEEPEADS